MDEDLKQAVERLHHCKATFTRRCGRSGEVRRENCLARDCILFGIKGHSQTGKCYAWSSPIEGSTKRRYYAVLHISPIDSPEKAVRASIAQDYKAGNLK